MEQHTRRRTPTSNDHAEGAQVLAVAAEEALVESYNDDLDEVWLLLMRAQTEALVAIALRMQESDG